MNLSTDDTGSSSKQSKSRDGNTSVAIAPGISSSTRETCPASSPDTNRVRTEENRRRNSSHSISSRSSGSGKGSGMNDSNMMVKWTMSESMGEIQPSR